MGQRKERKEMGQTSHHNQVGGKGRGLNAQPRFFQVSKSFAVTDEEGLRREEPLSPVVLHLSGRPEVLRWASLAHAGAAQHLCMSQLRCVGSQLPGEDGAEGQPGSVSKDSRSPSASATAQREK